METKQYYSLEKILQKKDLNDEEPSIYMITSNRSAGKTTSTLKYLLEEYWNKNSQMCLFYRNRYEIGSCAELFNDIAEIYPDLCGEVKTKSHAQGLFYEIIMETDDGDKTIGYSISLYNPDALKKYSPMFAHVDSILFDEFQLESGRYIKNEVKNMQSILMTIARGGGSQSRHVRMFMLGNNVTVMNPYFITFGIHKRLRQNTHFLRGEGWVAEFEFNESASNAIKENNLFKAFSSSNYMLYSTENVYLNDSEVFIQKPTGKSRYLMTFISEENKYAIREFEDGYIYCTTKIDPQFPTVVTFNIKDHNQTTIMIDKYCDIWDRIWQAYKTGYMRFENLQCKNVIFDILAIDIT